MVFVEKNDNKKLKRGFFLVPLAVIVLLAGLSYGIYYLWQSGIKDSPRIEIENPTIDKIREKIDPSPTSFPFRKLTIPYLREREYKSNLGEMQKIGETGSYESFVASFDSDGLKEYGLLTKPKGEIPAGGWPAVVFVHGYIPPKNYRTKVNYVSYVDQIAKNGLIVFKIDLRGHDQSEGEPGGGYYSGDYIIDTLNAVSALKNSDFVNPERIGLWGHSMAGNVTFRSFVASQKINAIVIWAGAGYTYEDLQDYAIDDNSYRPPAEDSEQSRKRRELRELYRGFDKKHWFWKQVPATNYLDGVTGSIQINHTLNDPVVSIDYSRNLMKILDGTNIKHDLIEYSSGGHNITGPSFGQAMQNSVDFYKENL